MFYVVAKYLGQSGSRAGCPGFLCASPTYIFNRLFKMIMKIRRLIPNAGVTLLFFPVVDIPTL